MLGYKIVKKKIKEGYFKKIDAFGLGFFRISFFTVLLFEVFDLLKFNHLIYDKVPFIEAYEINFSLILTLWMVCIFFVIIGLKTRTALILNYFFSLVCVGTIGSYEYHMFYSYMAVSFLGLFIPLGKDLSIDRLLSNISYDYKLPPPKTSVLNYYAFLFIGVGLVYFDSIFHKITSFHWLNGLGVWYPSSIPQIVINDFTPFLNMKWLMIGLGYLVVVFEAIFIFTFWFNKFRIPFVIIGIGLHVGIYVSYPIPYFGLGVACVYILLIPVSWWRPLRNKISTIRNFIPFSKIQPLLQPAKQNQDSPQIEKLKINLISIGLILLCVFQLLCIYKSPGINYVLIKSGIKNTFFDNKVNDIYEVQSPILKSFLGLTKHPVFMDGHFQKYDQLIGIKYNNTFIPITQENGMPGSLLQGGTWIKWTWRTNAPLIDKKNFESGVRDFTAYWAFLNQVSLEDTEFEIVLKKIEIPTYWEKDFLKTQLAKPWKSIGKAHWHNNQIDMSNVDYSQLNMRVQK